MKPSRAIASAVLLTASAYGASYHLIKQIPIGGDGGWDYLTMDNDARLLYISHATHVVVFDVDAEKVAGDIPDTQGVHGIALAHEIGRGYVSCGRANSVTVFDLKTLKTLGKVDAGKNPDAILWDDFSHRILAMNGGSHDVSVIDPEQNKVEHTIPVGGKPEFAAADGKGHVYVNIEDKSEVVEIDSKKMNVSRRWPLAPCEEPSGMAMDRKNRRLFIGCSNKLMAVVDPDEGKVLTTLPVGEGVDANGFDPGAGLAFSSNGEGTLTVVREKSPSEFEVVENVPTQRGARTMTVDLKTHTVYLPTAKFGPPPAATAEHPHPRPAILPGSFVLLVVGK